MAAQGTSDLFVPRYEGQRKLDRADLLSVLHRLVSNGAMKKNDYKEWAVASPADLTAHKLKGRGYLILKKDECHKDLYPFFLTDNKNASFDEYCSEMADRWLKEYKIAIFLSKQVEHRLSSQYPYIKSNGEQQKHLLLVPFFNMLLYGVGFLDFALCDDRGVDLLDIEQYSNKNSLFDSNSITGCETIYSKSKLTFSQLMRTAFEAVWTSLNAEGVQRPKRLYSEIVASGGSERDALRRRLSDRNRHSEIQTIEGMITAKCHSLGKPNISIADIFKCTISAMHIHELITIKQVRFGGGVLYAFRIEDEIGCKHFFNEIFLSPYMDSTGRYTLPSPGRFLLDMYDFWSKYLRFMIYNTPAPPEGGQVDTPAFHQVFDHEHQNRAKLYQGPDTLMGKAFDLLVPLPSLIKKGVVFLQIDQGSVNMNGVSVQKFRRSNDGTKLMINQHKEAFINFLVNLGK